MARTQQVKGGCLQKVPQVRPAHLLQVDIGLHHLLDGVFRKGHVGPQEAGQALIVLQEVFQFEA